MRIVVEPVEIFGAELVRLRFLAAAVFRDIAGGDSLRGLRCRIGGASHSLALEHHAKDCSGHDADAGALLARGALRAVPRRDVPDLMSDDTRQVGLAIHVSHDAARDIHVAAGQCEGIDVGAVENREVPVKLGPMRGLGEALADFVDVGLDLRILVFTELREDLRVRLRAFGHLGALVHDRALFFSGDGVFDCGTTRNQRRGGEAGGNQKSAHGNLLE